MNTLTSFDFDSQVLQAKQNRKPCPATWVCLEIYTGDGGGRYLITFFILRF